MILFAEVTKLLEEGRKILEDKEQAAEVAAEARCLGYDEIFAAALRLHSSCLSLSVPRFLSSLPPAPLAVIPRVSAGWSSTSSHSAAI